MTEVHLYRLTIYARPALPTNQLAVMHHGYQITAGAFSDSAYHTQHYGCDVHIATLHVTTDEAQCLQKELGLMLQDSIGEPEELDDIKMTEQRRLLGIKNPLLT
ncbi:hypothetical protein DVH07_18505 [Hafnia paralvei]|uniref:hypothetical protein n=1 Tax=Hafnia paralvei TaxID=546367 RepID=UPI000DF451A9|nr:hypothetical protein [Hafnia paralvei]RDA61929.1 hypothetical protein DU449_18065 [Hafnia paralvei]RDA62989.1 hypothetical protein DVH08_20275 [Hafnia paralvei]RDA63829.1 hypothetical protein DVH09_18635 [Hafnia paralvei]RDA75115.1 hypothetical protein DVH10_17805 [Hafnia paralvei]RDA75520.1 hypothetical protein DVH07_18505 [Hafnia paralvei]